LDQLVPLVLMVFLEPLVQRDHWDNQVVRVRKAPKEMQGHRGQQGHQDSLEHRGSQGQRELQEIPVNKGLKAHLEIPEQLETLVLRVPLDPLDFREGLDLQGPQDSRERQDNRVRMVSLDLRVPQGPQEALAQKALREVLGQQDSPGHWAVLDPLDNRERQDKPVPQDHQEPQG
jgi:hypothetical protein